MKDRKFIFIFIGKAFRSEALPFELILPKSKLTTLLKEKPIQQLSTTIVGDQIYILELAIKIAKKFKTILNFNASISLMGEYYWSKFHRSKVDIEKAYNSNTEQLMYSYNDLIYKDFEDERDLVAFIVPTEIFRKYLNMKKITNNLDDNSFGYVVLNFPEIRLESIKII